ncbi:Piso0_002424 [Millerozyma farinosa CBS 7064]|uniref:Piso0_002424 protein n=1 Tax=Pichia sorbitophila (strain ATCC MYA-4447 / BCRC 22081 / CBS 7064 / NBRC 10061 / NRRL Y-12695) TaxID=559304 RepID=G8YCK5_PICSO|nr:Piso0_002424 [Millerozyma farinosa CBS 7064]
MVFKFTIDKVVNKYLPRNQVKKFPKALQRLLGEHQVKPYSDYWIWIEILVSSFCGIALLEGIFKSHTVFTKHHAPMIIASYGATAILCFNSSQVPLAQPRNIFLGHFTSSLIGVCITKLFSLSHQGRANYWAAGALSVGVSSVLMSILNCVHPPAGASALLPATDVEIREMSWWYLPVQIISSLLIICVALITGNLLRKYPIYWWSPETHETPAAVKPTKTVHSDNISVSPNFSTTSSPDHEEENKLAIEEEKGIERASEYDKILVEVGRMWIPDSLDLDPVEMEWLESLQVKLKAQYNKEIV